MLKLIHRLTLKQKKLIQKSILCLWDVELYFSQSKNFMYQTSLANPNPWQVICAMSSQFTQMTQHNGRRSANYQQSHWKFEFLQCLGNDVKVIFYIFKLIFVFVYFFLVQENVFTI